jgi:serine/threonine-protein kinase
MTPIAIQKWEIPACSNAVLETLFTGASALVLRCKRVGGLLLPAAGTIAMGAALGGVVLGVAAVAGGKVVDNRKAAQALKNGSRRELRGEDTAFVVVATGEEFRLAPKGMSLIGIGSCGTVKAAGRMPGGGFDLARKIAIGTLEIEMAIREAAITQRLTAAGVPDLLAIVYAGPYMKSKPGRTGRAFHSFSIRCTTDLNQRLREKDLTGPQKFHLIDRLIATCSAVEENGIVHRDIKPDNIFLLEAPDGTLTPKLGDFGFAFDPLKDRAEQQSLSGTPLYMPPGYIERKFHPHPSLSPLSFEEMRKFDSYSLGRVFLELLMLSPATSRIDLCLKPNRETLPADWLGDSFHGKKMVQLINSMLLPDATARPNMQMVASAWAEIRELGEAEGELSFLSAEPLSLSHFYDPRIP